MKLSDFQQNLKKLFTNSNGIKQVLETLNQTLNLNGNSYDHFLNIYSRYNELQDKIQTGTIINNEADANKNQIRTSLLSLINNLKEGDLEVNKKPKYREIKTKILVFTLTKEIKEVDDFFVQFNFSKAKVYAFDDTTVDINDFDLVIFDNRDLPFCRNLEQVDEMNKQIILERIEKMNQVINHSSKFIIHFGEILFWVNQNRDRVQAANSRFSLYARTKEVIDYINAYRA